MEGYTQVTGIQFGARFRAFHLDVEGVRFVIIAFLQDGVPVYHHIPLNHAEALVAELSGVIEVVTDNRMVVTGPANAAQVD